MFKLDGGPHPRCKANYNFPTSTGTVFLFSIVQTQAVPGKVTKKIYDVKLIAYSFFILVSSHLLAQAHGGVAVIAADSQFVKHGALFKFLWGQNYRKVWATPLAVHYFSLTDSQHKFVPVRTGGGLQTRSLVVKDGSGAEWSLRSVQKNPDTWLSPFLRKTFVRNIVRDQVSASFPYGSLAVPRIADALNIANDHPRLVLISNDTSLGKYEHEFAGRLCFLEDRNPKGKSVSTEKMFKIKDSIANVFIDTMTYLKCRLMDIVLGDWDRHPGQYKWYCDTLAGVLVYVPIPGDRDQAFFRLEGLIPSVILNFGAMSYMEGFNPTVKNINGFMARGRSLDKKILSNMSKEKWQQVTSEVKTTLTDAVLIRSVEDLPTELTSYHGFLQATMMARRDKLDKLSVPYYKKIVRRR